MTVGPTGLWTFAGLDIKHSTGDWGLFFHPVVDGISLYDAVQLGQNGVAIYDQNAVALGGQLLERHFQLGSYTNGVDQLRLQYIIP